MLRAERQSVLSQVTPPSTLLIMRTFQYISIQILARHSLHFEHELSIPGNKFYFNVSEGFNATTPKTNKRPMLLSGGFL